jgi:Ca2+-binding RTX toxin-like protein
LGGSGNDTSAFVESGHLSGSLDGGAGNNTLDFSAYTAGGIQVNLGTMAGTGTQRFWAALSAIFLFLVGSPATGYLRGPVTSTESNHRSGQRQRLVTASTQRCGKYHRWER